MCLFAEVISKNMSLQNHYLYDPSGTVQRPHLLYVHCKDHYSTDNITWFQNMIVGVLDSSMQLVCSLHKSSLLKASEH